MNKKWTVGSALLAGAVLAGLAAQPQTGVHAADQTPATAATQVAAATPAATDEATQSQTPADQTVKPTGTSDTITPADADTTNYKNVGENAKVMVSEQYDEAGNLDDTYKASVVNRDAFTSDDAPASDEGVTRLDAETIMDGDTTHYAEYVNGSWQVNSLTMQGGRQVADRQSFDLDVSAVVSGAEVTHDFPIADGVTVHVGKSEHSQELNDKYGNNMVTGAYLTVEVYGTNAFDDNYQVKVDDENGIGQMGTGFINVPFTIHYFNADGGIVTGTLSFINGEITKTPAEDNTDTDTNTDTNTDAGTATTPETDPDKGTVTDPDDGATDEETTPSTDNQTTPSTEDNATAGVETEPTTEATDENAKADTDKDTTPAPAAKTGDTQQPAKKPAAAVKTVTTKKAESLPQTGDKQSRLGLIGVSLLAVLGLGGVLRKRRA